MIVISYRRADSPGFTRALQERLVQQFGARGVFLDLDTIEAGEDFRERLRQAVAGADGLVLVIGPLWASPAQLARLAEPDDAVRLEIATALSHDVRILPVLVDGAGMPRAADLPAELRALADRNAIALSHDRFEEDVERLVRGLATRRLPNVLLTTALILGLAGALAWVLLAGRSPLYTPVLLALAVFTAAAAALLFRGSAVRRSGGARLLTPGLSAALFTLVVVGGLAARGLRQARSFDLTVRVSGPAGETVSAGSITLDLASDRRQAPLNAQGEAVFRQIPGRLAEGAVTVTPEVEGYESRATTVSVPDDRVLQLTLEHRVYTTRVSGSVVDALGRPLSGVRLDFGSGLATARTDSAGNYTVTLSVAPGTVMLVRAVRGSVTGYADRLTIPASTPLIIRFDTGT